MRRVECEIIFFSPQKDFPAMTWIMGNVSVWFNTIATSVFRLTFQDFLKITRISRNISTELYLNFRFLSVNYYSFTLDESIRKYKCVSTKRTFSMFWNAIIRSLVTYELVCLSLYDFVVFHSSAADKYRSQQYHVSHRDQCCAIADFS